MPAKGGSAGKAGDQYEALWVVDEALRIVLGLVEHVIYESLDPEQSRGVEFSVLTTSGDTEFWSLKRQTTAAGWTLASLTRRDEHGRSILGDLIEHVERNNRNVAVFASTLGAAKLEELCSVAATAETLSQRLEQSAELADEHNRYFLPLFAGDRERARKFLLRLQIQIANETALRTRVESLISVLFYDEKGKIVDAAAVRRLLAEYMLEHMHERIDKRNILEHLASEGIRQKDWKTDKTTREKVTAICGAYKRPLLNQLINGIVQSLPGAEILSADRGMPAARRTLIVSGAGGGKSVQAAQLVDRMQGKGVPVLPVRMDVINDDVLTTARLGEMLSLPASPVAVLVGLADGGDCVLIIDQLDAVSVASGRRTEVWSLFEQILTEADGYPNMRVVVGCREFDLEHDQRMRSLGSSFTTAKLESFDLATLDEILSGRKVHVKLKSLLIVPLHLAMFLSLKSEDSEALETRDDLYQAFWLHKQRQATQRLGRTCDFTGVIDRLARWLSENQELSAPEHVLDEVRADADALASEHVLVLADGRFRFFHETFFDYAFARRFAQSGGSILNMLLGSEQHLFRRAQVRQLLSFLRSSEPARYIRELQSLLLDGRVRFHIKRLILQFLGALSDPTAAEWQVLSRLETEQPDLLSHVNKVVSNHTGWFDVLDSAKFFDVSLSSTDGVRDERAVWLCGMPQILEKRSSRVAELLKRYRNREGNWPRYLQYICRSGNAYHGREMFDLFLSLISDGTLDGTRPGFAVNDSWWSGFYSMAEKAPALASEAVAVWFDRRLELWREERARLISDDMSSEGHHLAESLRRQLAGDGDDHGVIAKAAKAPLAFVQHLLPRVAGLVAEHAKSETDELDSDPLWASRFYQHDGHSVHEAILSSLASAMEELARQSPRDLDRLLEPYVDRPHDTIGYLVLRAWTAAPAVYAERLAQFLSEDPRRLKIGYSFWGGGNAGVGMAEQFRSIEAVRAVSPHCSEDQFKALENAIVNLRDERESRELRWRGVRQLQLLAAMDPKRLTPVGQAKLAELRDKFPDVTHNPPKPYSGLAQRESIEDNAQKKMTDEQWLSAMLKYAGVRPGTIDHFENAKGELAGPLEQRTKDEPKRFAALARRIPTNLPGSYFNAIIRGIAAAAPPGNLDVKTGFGSDVVALLERAHSLPNHPCGRWIAYLIEKWSKVEWPQSILEMIVWYATEHPDPSEEVWRRRTPGGQLYDGGSPDSSGMNSTRGAAANAIAALLFARETSPDVLANAIQQLAHDSSVAVRSQAIHALLALLNTRPDGAMSWFVECVGLDPVLLKTAYVEQFIYYAGHRNYLVVRPVLQQMLVSTDSDTVKAAARLTCLLALKNESAVDDAIRVRAGNQDQREAAATIYATNVAHKDVGATCRALLPPFFVDSEVAVQAEAANAFQHIAKLDEVDQANLLGAFLDAKPHASALERAIRSLEDSPVRLPDLVCRLIELGVKEYKSEGGDIRKHGSLVAHDLSKIVIRLYAQSDDVEVRKRCLDAIDQMEMAGFFGLSDELGRLDR